MGRTVVFIADETDREDIEAVCAALRDHEIVGLRISPTELAIYNEGQRIRVLRGREPLTCDLVVGWLFEDWLGPAGAILTLLALAGYKVINDFNTLFNGQNKAIMSGMLHSAGVPHEPFLFSWAAEPALWWCDALNSEMVCKPGLVIAGGRTVCNSGSGICKTPDRESLVSAHAILSSFHQPLYLQRYLRRNYLEDIRLYVFGFQTVLAYTKVISIGEWRGNVAFGATAKPCELTTSLQEIGIQAAKAVGAPIAGVDVGRSSTGALSVFEVNTCPTFLHSRQVLGKAVEEAFAAYLACECVKDAAGRRSAATHRQRSNNISRETKGD
jgi:glutathione synthase/RimK-type ligase-like ATP-grasp enzyme